MNDMNDDDYVLYEGRCFYWVLHSKSDKKHSGVAIATGTQTQMEALQDLIEHSRRDMWEGRARKQLTVLANRRTA